MIRTAADMIKRALDVQREPHCSPSQFSTWSICKRKWAYSRFRPRVENKYADFGTRVHTILENWLTDRTPIDTTTAEGKTAVAGLPYLPLPGHALVEYNARPRMLVVTWDMRIDFLYGHVLRDTIVVGDHKTTGDWRWAKTPEQLADDPQRVVYSHWAASTLGLDHVTVHWRYYNRNDKTSRPVLFEESADGIAERFDYMHREAVLLIIGAADFRKDFETDEEWVESLPRDETLEACSAFGGCPYREECHSLIPASDLARLHMATHVRKETK